MNETEAKRMELRQGVMVFGGLALLTIIEYFVGTLELGSIFLWVIALLKAGLVLWFFMHVFRVFGVEEEGHE
jgi:cytochrome c oxidase subunit 4